MDHFEPEKKRQSMDYCYKVSLAQKKFKTAPSGGKVMLTVFWDINGVVHSEFMPTGITVNSGCFVGTLQKLKARIQRVLYEMYQVFL
jgi:hypothetical protein